MRLTAPSTKRIKTSGRGGGGGEEGVRADVFGLWGSKSRTVRSKEASTASHHHSSARPAVPLICRFKHGVFMNYGAASKSTPSHVDGFAISLW